MGQAIMLGTLFGLIVLIVGLVLRFDPEARRAAGPRGRAVNQELTPLLIASMAFAYVGGIVFLVAGIYLSWRRRRLHPLLLVSHLGDRRSRGSKRRTTGRCTPSSRRRSRGCRRGGRST